MDEVSILYSCDQVNKDEIVHEENLSAENGFSDSCAGYAIDLWLV